MTEKHREPQKTQQMSIETTSMRAQPKVFFSLCSVASSFEFSFFSSLFASVPFVDGLFFKVVEFWSSLDWNWKVKE